MNAVMERETPKIAQKEEYIPTAELRRFVATLYIDEVAGRPYRAEKLTGINRRKFYHALEDPQFVEWFDKQRVKYRKAQSIVVEGALMRMVEVGEVPAIRTFYELEGALNKGQKNGNSNGGGGTLLAINIHMHDKIDAPVDKSVSPSPVIDSEFKVITI